MIHGTPSSERREQASWRWWNVALGSVIAGVVTACAAGAYAFWWLFL